MERVIEIDGKPVRFKATAALLRMYRMKFNRDMLKDVMGLGQSLEKAEGGGLDAPELTVFENISYIMAKQADPESVPAQVEEWLDGFNVFSICEVFPKLMELWGENMQTAAVSKKKPARRAGK